MNHQPPSPQDEAARLAWEQREWERQERAVRAERLDLDPGDDASLLRYRAVVRSLRRPLDASLPADFARNVALRAHPRNAPSMRLELGLSWGLVGVLATILIALAMFHSDTWRRVLPLHALSNPWLLMLIACLALSGIMDRLAFARIDMPHRPAD